MAPTHVETELIATEVDELVALVGESNADADTSVIRRAAAYSAERHAGQLRKSGEPFVMHPIAVAKICAGLRQEPPVIVAALLHDVLEDTGASRDDIAAEFGEEVALLVDGVTKLSRIQFGTREEAQAETYRKMILSMAQDVRVILVKLADRMHNLRTIGALPKQKQMQKARETLEVYAPLAHRLGIHSFKWELEDLAFETLHPRRYAEIQAMVNQRRNDRERFVEEAGGELDNELQKVGIAAEIRGRAKHFYSIYMKMAKGGKEFNEIFDLTAMRVMVDSVKDCYGAIGIIHSLWKPMPGRFKDYVAMPKSNGYQSLHTTVIGPHGKPLEIQVRTQQMHQTAEFGVAAHWLYKHKGPTDKRGGRGTALPWFQEVMATAQERDSGDFLDTLRVDLFDDEVFVFTPAGEVKALPSGATPLDFAYSVHTDVGHRCVGAKVNGRIVPLHYRAAVGRDRRDPDVEGRARPVARLDGHRHDVAGAQQDPPLVRPRAARGPRAEGPRLARAGLPRATGCRTRSSSSSPLAGTADPRDGLQEGRGLLRRDRRRQGAGRPDREQGAAAAQDRGRRRGRGRDLRRPPARRAARRTRRASTAWWSTARTTRTCWCAWRSAARRCPATRSPATSRSGRGVTVHRTDCPERPRAAAHARSGSASSSGRMPGSQSFRVEIAVAAWDRPRLLEDIARTFAEFGSNIVEYGGVVQDGMARNWYVVELGDVKALGRLLSALRNVEAIFDANRVTPRAASAV